MSTPERYFEDNGGSIVYNGRTYKKPKLKELALDKLADKEWRLDNLYFIINEDGELVRFRLRPIQKHFLRNMWYRNIILKSRQHGFCCDPSTRVLTADLKWVRIEDLKVGEQVVAVDEHKQVGRGKARKMRTATVEAVGEVYDHAYKITMSDGRELICNDRHPWLGKARKATDLKWRSISGKGNNVVGKIKEGFSLRSITRPWDEDRTPEDGWMGGMIDGEGTVAKQEHPMKITITQRPGKIWDRMDEYAFLNGYEPTYEKDRRYLKPKEERTCLGNGIINRLSFGRMEELFRLVAKTRPSKLEGTRFWEGRELPGKRSAAEIANVEVVKIEYIGKQRLIDLQTSEKTFIAEGFVSHNTTFIEIWKLDTAIFTKNFKGVIIAHKKEDASEILSSKVEVPYANLHPDIVARVGIKSSNKSMIEFSNGSSIKVTTSGRSGTAQSLHVSEIGYTAKHRPDVAQEIKLGSLPAVHQKGFVFFESTADGAGGMFFDMSMKALNDSREGKKLTPFDFKFFFYAWFDKPDNVLTDEDADVQVLTAEMDKYFSEVEEAAGITLSWNQKAWYIVQADIFEDKMKQEHPSTPEEAFANSGEGFYFLKQMGDAREQGRLISGGMPHSNHPVRTYWDIGVNDPATCWFIQRVGVYYHVLGYYEDTDNGMDHHISQVKFIAEERGWRLADDWIGPHDMKKRNPGNSKTLVKECAGYGAKFKVVPKVPNKILSIQAARRMISMCKFDKEGPNMELGMSRMDNYRKEWNKQTMTWADKPRKDMAGHGADAFQCFAMYEESGSDYDTRPAAQPDPRNHGMQPNAYGESSPAQGNNAMRAFT